MLYARSIRKRFFILEALGEEGPDCVSAHIAQRVIPIPMPTGRPRLNRMPLALRRSLLLAPQVLLDQLTRFADTDLKNQARMRVVEGACSSPAFLEAVQDGV